MKDFKFFPTLTEYREYIYSQIFKTKEFREHPFYKGLIEWIIVNKTPVFFELSHGFEFPHFSQYYYGVLDRGEYYQNDFVRSMYFGHDFVHMLFPQPLRPRDLTFGAFSNMLNVNEWVASNETETLTYYRIPEMREQSLPYKILYDVLLASGITQKPSVEFLLQLRKDIIFNHETDVTKQLCQVQDSDEVLAYLRKFLKNNAVWCDMWYNYFPEMPAEYEHEGPYLSVLDYEPFLEHYKPDGWYNQQFIYERNTLRNVRNIARLVGPAVILPTRFEDIPEALQRLQGKTIMADAAKHFHETYIKNKTVGTGAKK